jgi:hypothetical protein
MPLASETSMGAIEPRKSEGKKDETSDILAVASYSSGFCARIYTANKFTRIDLNRTSRRE